MFSFFTGRSGRQEYWISVGLLIVVALVLSYLKMESASAAITIMWIITWLRRLHDIGRPGWWAAVPLVLIIAIVMGGVALGGQPLINALAAVQGMNTSYAIPDNIAMILIGIGLSAVIIQFGFTIWLGAKKGDEGSNRFGPPPDDVFKRS